MARHGQVKPGDSHTLIRKKVDGEWAVQELLERGTSYHLREGNGHIGLTCRLGILTDVRGDLRPELFPVIGQTKKMIGTSARPLVKSTLPTLAAEVHLTSAAAIWLSKASEKALQPIFSTSLVRSHQIAKSSLSWGRRVKSLWLTSLQLISQLVTIAIIVKLTQCQRLVREMQTEPGILELRQVI